MPEQREIVLIPVPFTNLETTKKRPVVVLSNTGHNNKSEDVIVAAITSNIDSKGDGICIGSDDLDWGSLPVKSFIRADKIYTLSKDIIIRKYGCLNLISFKSIIEKLNHILSVD